MLWYDASLPLTGERLAPGHLWPEDERPGTGLSTHADLRSAGVLTGYPMVLVDRASGGRRFPSAETPGHVQRTVCIKQPPPQLECLE